jgi:4-aminobutyrate aminotransferase-like enzyme
MRKFARLLALALVAALSVMQLINIPDELKSLGDTALQRSVQFAGALYSVLGVFLVVGALRGRGWAVTIAIAWALTVTYTASAATLAWNDIHESGIVVGAISAGLSCILLGWWVTWAARASVTRHIPSTSDSASPTQ